MTDSSNPKVQEAAQAPELSIPKLIDQLAIGAFLFVLFFYGMCITGVVFKEPDICFLLGQGRWIVEHGRLPATDPFSYTTGYYPHPYVIEKWLSEVIFFAVEKSLGLVGLLLFDGLVLATAFVIIPYRIAHLCGLRGGAAMRLTSLTTLTSLCHLSVRPEVFSYLFVAIWFELMVRMNKATAGNTKIRWDLIAILAVLMCLWNNIHTLFIIGILIPGFYSFCALVERFLPGLKEKPFNWTPLIATVACILASLVNPYGIGQWTYLPIVFGEFNSTVNDMQPLKLSNAGNPLFIPFYLFTLLGLKGLIKGWRLPLQQGDLFFRGLIPLGILGGVKAIRSIPISGLFLDTGRANLIERTNSADSEESSLAGFTNPFKPVWPLACIAAILFGVYICTYSVVPMIPQNSAAFQPPFKAIEFIEKNRPKGNMLNDPHFGAVMIYKMRSNPLVFVDPRYNLYGEALVQDYWHMVNCDPNSEELLNRYKIDWVFLAPNTKLSKQMATDVRWQRLYCDKESVIYSRSSANPEMQIKAQ